MAETETTVTIDGNIVYQQRVLASGKVEHITNTCATRRVAQVHAATIALRSKGWGVSSIGSSDKPCRPLLLPGEKMAQPLDGALSDQRAQGFVARRGADQLGVDACAGMPLMFFGQLGDPSEAIEICHWYIGG
jgi:hypothetical protein